MSGSDTMSALGLDAPEVTRRLFFPRPGSGLRDHGGGVPLSIPVAAGISLGARFHEAGREDPVLLFFHGNGEIAEEYGEIGALYRHMNIHFLVTDYRGYGDSSGTPTFSAMQQDALALFAYVRRWLAGRGLTGPLVVMGRSLGSAPALEVASRHPGELSGLIIESGFARILPLLRFLGCREGFLSEAQGPGNLEKIGQVTIPTLVIHAGQDEIIDLSEGKALYGASADPGKVFLEVAGAGHNDLFLRGQREYLQAMGALVRRARQSAS